MGYYCDVCGSYVQGCDPCGQCARNLFNARVADAPARWAREARAKQRAKKKKAKISRDANLDTPSE